LLKQKSTAQQISERWQNNSKLHFRIFIFRDVGGFEFVPISFDATPATKLGTWNLAASAGVVVMPSKNLAALPDPGSESNLKTHCLAEQKKGSFFIFTSKCRFDEISRLAASQSQWVLHFSILVKIDWGIPAE